VRGVRRRILGARQQSRDADEPDGENAERGRRELDARPDPFCGDDRGDPRAEEQAEAPRAVQRRQHGTAEPPLDEHAVRVRRYVEDPEARTEDARRGHEHTERRRERGGGESARHHEHPERDRPATPAMRGERAGRHEHQRGGQRDAEDRDPERAAVEVQPALERRQPCRPRPVDGAERDERDGKCDVRAADHRGTVLRAASSAR
jgi:hypothetical protein